MPTNREPKGPVKRMKEIIIFLTIHFYEKANCYIMRPAICFWSVKMQIWLSELNDQSSSLDRLFYIAL